MTIRRHPKLPRTTWNRRVVVRPLALRRRDQRNWRAWVARKAEAGLTSRGKVPQRRIEQRLLQAEIDALAAAINRVYEELPPAVQARCILLSDQLGKVRRKLI
ncbi:MAG: hypothetical protein P4N60_11185 [Verrucomicrobiae bacterium]|nr:hypothetical protein [Verrucomicrobiae bacterium]